MRCVEYDRLPQEIGQLDSKLHMVKTKFPKLSHDLLWAVSYTHLTLPTILLV